MIILFLLFSIELEYKFNPPMLEKVGNYYRIHLPPLQNSAPRVGEPKLPHKTRRILVPMGEEVERIEVIGRGEEKKGKYLIEPQKPSYPLSEKREWTIRLSKIYEKDTLLPGKLYKVSGIYYLCGHKILHLTLYPVQYNPQKGKIYYHPHLKIIIHTQKKSTQSPHPLLRVNEETHQRIFSIVDNPSLLTTYTQFSFPTDTVDYVIITSASLMKEFTPFVEFKNTYGIVTSVVSVEKILKEYPGKDTQERIRNFIIHWYQIKNLKYVLLGGDDRIIPHRGLYDVVNEGEAGWDYEEYDIPADIYYAGLDGNWNEDGDNKWGEKGEGDLYQEIIIGRLPVEDKWEVRNFVNKVIKYSTLPDSNVVTTGLMVGEDLGWVVWGRDYKEEIRVGSSNWGITTSGFPSYFEVDTIYDRVDYHFTPAEVVKKLNEGLHLVNHIGHANTVKVMKLPIQEVRGVRNSFYFIIHSQGCYPGAFDNRFSDGSYAGYDCIGEMFVLGSSGASAFVGNSRYGWGSYDSTDGASQFFDREFFDAIFGEERETIGEILQDAKEDLADKVNTKDAIRWVYYSLNLLGEPTMKVWTQKPTKLQVEYPEEIYVGKREMTVKIKPKIEGKIILKIDTIFYLRKNFNQEEVKLELNLSNPGSLHLAIDGRNCLPYEVQIPVLDTTTKGTIKCMKIEIDDDTIGGSWGNSDEKVTPGEKIEIKITIKNLSTQKIEKIEGEIFCKEEGVKLIEKKDEIAFIRPEEEKELRYVIKVEKLIGENKQLEFEIKMKDKENQLWEESFKIRVERFEIKYEQHKVINKNSETVSGVLEEGVCSLYVSIKNDSKILPQTLTAKLRSMSSFVEFIESTAVYPVIKPCSTKENLTPFVIKVKNTTPRLEVIEFLLEVGNDYFSDSTQLKIKVGLGGDFLLWVRDKMGWGARVHYDSLKGRGYIGDYVEDLEGVRDKLSNYRTIFIHLGMAPWDNNLKKDENVDSIIVWLLRGGNLYLEGGEFWFSPSEITLQPYFHIEGINEGRNDIDTIVGVENTFTKGVEVRFKGERVSVDHIQEKEGAWCLFRNKPANYKIGVVFRSGTYNTIGLSFELATVEERVGEMLDSIMRWFEKEIKHDVSVWDIIGVKEVIEGNFTPGVVIKNLGKEEEVVEVVCEIKKDKLVIYRDTIKGVRLIPKESKQLYFNECHIGENEGSQYMITVFHTLEDDERGNNRREIKAVSVKRIIESKFTEEGIKLDGTIEEEEWEGVSRIDISDVIGKGWIGGGNFGGTVYLYVMNDLSYLYMGIEVKENIFISLSSSRSIYLVFDDNNDGKFPQYPDTSEGEIEIVYSFYNNKLKKKVEFFPKIRDTLIMPCSTDIPFAIDSSTFQCEFKIPISSKLPEYIQQKAGDTLGFSLTLVGRIGGPKAQVIDNYGWWPQDLDSLDDLERMGKIVLSLKEKVKEEKLKISPIANPMKGGISFSYFLPTSGEVTISIYNVVGQLLFRERDIKEKGWHKMEWKESTLPSGVYFCKLKTLGKGKVVKLVVIN